MIGLQPARHPLDRDHGLLQQDQFGPQPHVEQGGDLEQLAQQAGISPAELKIIQSLSARRTELDARDQDFATTLPLMVAAADDLLVAHVGTAVAVLELSIIRARGLLALRRAARWSRVPLDVTVTLGLCENVCVPATLRLTASDAAGGPDPRREGLVLGDIVKP